MDLYVFVSFICFSFCFFPLSLGLLSCPGIPIVCVKICRANLKLWIMLSISFSKKDLGFFFFSPCQQLEWGYITLNVLLGCINSKLNFSLCDSSIFIVCTISRVFPESQLKVWRVYQSLFSLMVQILSLQILSLQILSL